MDPKTGDNFQSQKALEAIKQGGLTGQGITAIWEQVKLHHLLTLETGDWEKRRTNQQIKWMWALVEDRLIHSLKEEPELTTVISATEIEVQSGTLSPFAAAERIIDLFHSVLSKTTCLDLQPSLTNSKSNGSYPFSLKEYRYILD